jgi:hypothetical protein
MNEDQADGKGEPASFDSPKIIVTHHPIKGQRMRIEQPGDSDDTGTLAGHTAKVFYNFVEEHLPFPELPNFGVLHLSVPKAAALIAEDLIRSGRSGVVERKEGSVPGRERSLSELTAQFQARLLRSIDRGTLRYFAGARDLADLLEPGPSDLIPERTHIHYNDLVKWLIAQGYVDHAGRSDAGPALLEYEQDELELAEKIELDVKTRRAMQLRLKPPKTRWDEVYPPLPEPDDRIAIQEALSQALARVGELENDLREAKALGTNKEDRPLTPRARKSHHVLIAGLCDALGINIRLRDATSSIDGKLAEAGLKLDKGTIKGILEDAKVYMPRSKPLEKRKSDIRF